MMDERDGIVLRADQ